MNPIFPSILSTNYFDLETNLEIFASNGIDFIHLDIMDGHFVDNLSFGPSSIPALKSKFDFKIDSHLMVSNPEKMIPKFIDSGSDWISFHIEVNDKIKENISCIKEKGLKAGLVLNPDTDVKSAFEYLDMIDYILLMSVFPGRGGQKFIESTLDKTFELKERIIQQGNNCLIQVDGGINSSNIRKLRQAGTDLFIIGTFLYNSNNIQETLKILSQEINGV